MSVQDFIEREFDVDYGSKIAIIRQLVEDTLRETLQQLPAAQDAEANRAMGWLMRTEARQAFNQLQQLKQSLAQIEAAIREIDAATGAAYVAISGKPDNWQPLPAEGIVADPSDFYSDDPLIRDAARERAQRKQET